MRWKTNGLYSFYMLKGGELLWGLLIMWLIDVHHGLSWPAALGFRDPLQIFGLGTLLALVMIGAEVVLIRMFPHRWVVNLAQKDRFLKLPF